MKARCLDLVHSFQILEETYAAVIVSLICVCMRVHALGYFWQVHTHINTDMYAVN